MSDDFKSTDRGTDAPTRWKTLLVASRISDAKTPAEFMTIMAEVEAAFSDSTDADTDFPGFAMFSFIYSMKQALCSQLMLAPAPAGNWFMVFEGGKDRRQELFGTAPDPAPEPPTAA